MEGIFSFCRILLLTLTTKKVLQRRHRQTLRGVVLRHIGIQLPRGDSIAQTRHQALIKAQIVDSVQHAAEYLAAFVEVIQIRARKMLTGVAIAGFI